MKHARPQARLRELRLNYAGWRDKGFQLVFGDIAHSPTTFVLDRKHIAVRGIAGRIPPGMWDDIAELVLA